MRRPARAESAAAEPAFFATGAQRPPPGLLKWAMRMDDAPPPQRPIQWISGPEARPVGSPARAGAWMRIVAAAVRAE